MLDVIVLSKDHPEYFARCVERLNAQDAAYHGVLVDNSSHRESRTAVATREIARDNRWTIVDGDKDLNYSASLNRAMSITDGDHVMWLSDDAYLHDGALEALLEADVPIITPLIVNSNNAVCFAGGSFDGVHPFHIGRGDCADNWRSNQVGVQDWITTPAALIKREVVDAVGALDEAYDWCYEDVDFCLAARQFGYQSYVHYGVAVTHDELGTKTMDGFRASHAHFVEKWGKELTGV